jgi:hypothetical protein
VRVPILAILALILASLACGQQIVTPAPTAQPSPLSPSATPAPTVTPTATPHEEHEEDVQTATVRAALVNVRTEPEGEVVGQLEAGTDVRVIECADGWCEVEADELTGWIFQGCLSIADGQGCEAK